MEDLLASIRRAIGEEGGVLPPAVLPAREPHHSMRPTARRPSEGATGFVGTPREPAARAKTPELPAFQVNGRREHLNAGAPSDILALRDKIGKELNSEVDPFAPRPPRVSRPTAFPGYLERS